MRLSGGWILLIFAALGIASLLFLLHLTKLGVLMHEHIPDRPKRRMFLASVSFFMTFLTARLLVLAILHNIGPFGWVIVGGLHIHHLVWGILLLLIVGYGYIAETGCDATPTSIFWSRLISIMYGVGAALALDELALWLNLENVYSSAKGRESIDAVILFGALLAAGTWGAPLFRAIFRKATNKPQKMAP